MKTKHLILSALVAAFAPTGVQAAVQLDAKPDRRILPADRSDCVVQISLRAKNKPKEKRSVPLNISLVLDRSSSMSGEKILKARQAACEAVNQLDPGDRVSIIAYDSVVEVLLESTVVDDREKIHRVIDTIETRGTTALYEGVKTGADQVRKHFDEDHINRVILLSDGHANVGPSSPEELAKLGRKLAAGGITVSTIGLGGGFNEDLMTGLADSSDGNYYFVEDPELLPEMFASEMGSVKSIVARNVHLQINLPDGVTAKGVLGDDEIQFDGGSATISVSDLSAAQERRFLVTCEVPSGSKDLALADVRLTYTDAESGKTESEAFVVSVTRSEDMAKSEKSVEKEVISNVAVTQNLLAKEKAVKLADSGQAEEAAKILRSQAATISAMPAAMQTDLLRAESQTLAESAAQIESSGKIDSLERKRILFENYQDKKQLR